MNSNNTQGSQEGVYTPEPRVYELGYLLMPTVDEGNLSNERDALVALITRYKGIVISEGQPQLIDTAYEISKVINNKRNSFTQAYFGWIKFDITPNVIDALTEEIEALETIIRSIMIKTVKENTLTSDQPFKLARTNNSDEEDIDEDDTDDDDDTEENDSKESTSSEDDLTKIEGIGPEIAKVLSANGVVSFEDLSASKVGDLRAILADNNLSSHEPKTWSKQATLAKHEKWDELATLQEELKGGK
tara:strand:- start:211 stop:948 length:738 start_codon:yes stop_codon:yes gene_type:complete